MTWIIFTLLIGIAGLISLACAIFGSSEANHTGDPSVKGLGIACAVLFAFIFLVFTFFASVHKVENGHVGLVKTFGAITGQRGDGKGGLTMTWPWQSIESANVQVQSMCPNGKPPDGELCKDNYGTFSKESIDVFVNAKLNFHVDPKQIQGLYRTVGPDYIAKIIQPRVSQIIKEETVKYTAVDIAPQRETIRHAVTQRLEKELADRSIIADDFLLTNVDFNPEVKKAIDQKVINAQNAEAAQAGVATAEAQARQAAATAEGSAQKLRIEAQGQADANRLVAASITPNLVQWQMIQKLSDKIQVMLVPQDGNFLFNLPGATAPAPAR